MGNIQEIHSTHINLLVTNIYKHFIFSSTAFARRGYKTITTIDRSKQSLIDNYNRISGFSQIDIQQLNLMYCSNRG